MVSPAHPPHPFPLPHFRNGNTAETCGFSCDLSCLNMTETETSTCKLFPNPKLGARSGPLQATATCG